MFDLEENPILTLMGSAALGGGLLASGAKALSPALRAKQGALAKLSSVGKAGLTGAAISAPLAGLSGLIGTSLRGTPDEDEISEGAPWTERSALGGAIGGGLLGGGLGAAAGAGKLRGLMAALGRRTNPELRKIVRSGLDELPTDNLFVDYFKGLSDKPGITSAMKGALAGGGTLGTIAAYQGADEGMQADIIAQELQKRRMSGGG
jgi:hypothetical protein